MLLFERYFLKKMALFFGVSLFGILFLYSLIDASTHFKLLKSSSLHFFEILLYFLARISKLFELFIPIAFALAFVASLGLSNSKNEILSLLSSGISARRILRPFFIFAGFTAFLILMHFQIFYPFLNQFENKLIEKEIKLSKVKEVHSLILKDGSRLLYQCYDAKAKVFHDLIWIKNIDEIYRIESLVVKGIPFGRNIELFERSDRVLKRHILGSKNLAEIKLDESTKNRATPYQLLSLSEIFSRFDERKPEIASLFYYRLFSSLIPLLAIFVLFPYLIRFSRSFHLFPLFFIALTFLFVFFTITRASLILAKGALIPPFWGIGGLFLIAFGISIRACQITSSQ